MAIKYGLTRTGDYLASNGTTIWNATTGAGYLNDITGIGRDDLSVLFQKQSKSQNSGSMVTMGLGTIATDNASNTNTFASDRTFVIWGNNAGSQDYDTDKITTNLPNGGVDGYLARIWQVQDNGVGAVQLNIDLSGVTISSVADAGDLVLLISDNASDFSNASVQFADAFAGNVATFNNVDFATGTRYFSIGRWKGTANISAEKGNFLNVEGDATKNVLLGSVALSGVNDNFTVETWVKRTSTSDGYILYNGSFGTDGYGLFFNSSGNIQPVIGAATITNSTATVIPVNTWAHVALVRAGGTLRLYVNGKEELLGSNPAVTAPTSLTRIGTRTTATFGFNGVIDEVRFWSVARSQTQLRESMHLVSTGSETGLANYYQFNATSGNVLDAVGGNDGTLQNSATRETSDCPIGKGRSFTVSNINAAGPHTFTNTGLQIQFAASGIYPEGDVVVTQIDGSGAPTNIPTGINTYSRAYWIVRNYGANSNFSELASIQFTVPNNDLISSGDVANPVDLRLFKRASNSGSSDAWTMIGSASAADATNLTITFNTFDPDFTSFSQVLPATVNSGTSSLPVTLSAFDAKRQDEKTVLVSWQTISEYGNAGFEVQRSENGKDFEILGFVDGAGNSQTKLNYRFVDHQATRSAYYRLKQIDNSGEFKYSPVVFVQGIDLQKISVYPNPFTKELKLDFGSTEPTKLPVSLEVYTAQGKRVLRKVGNVTKVQGALNEQINKLDNGVYLLRVIIGNKVHIKRVVKQ